MSPHRRRQATAWRRLPPAAIADADGVAGGAPVTAAPHLARRLPSPATAMAMARARRRHRRNPRAATSVAPRTHRLTTHLRLLLTPLCLPTVSAPIESGWMA